MVKGKKVVYPPGCKEINEELGKDELVRRLKVLNQTEQGFVCTLFDSL